MAFAAAMKRELLAVVENAGAGPLARYSNRCVALTPASVEVFQTAGVWERVVDQRVHPYRSMQVWDACSTGHIWLDADDVQ